MGTGDEGAAEMGTGGEGAAESGSTQAAASEVPPWASAGGARVGASGTVTAAGTCEVRRGGAASAVVRAEVPTA